MIVSTVFRLETWNFIGFSVLDAARSRIDWAELIWWRKAVIFWYAICSGRHRPVSFVGRSSIPQGCSAVEAAWCWWCHHSQRTLRNLGSVIALSCQWSLSFLSGIFGPLIKSCSGSLIVSLFCACQDYKIDHLVIPTRDYLYAPSLDDIDRAVAFIYSK